MSEAVRILVVGAGSVGGYFGGRLQEASRDVTFLVRAGRAAQLRRDGLRIESPHGDLTLEPRLVEAGGIASPYDVILLGVKGYALDPALDDLAPAVGSGSAILPVLNGLSHVDRLRERFGPAVIGGVCVVATELAPDGHIIQRNAMQKLVYGELDGTVTPRIQAIHAAFSDAGFDASVSTDIVAAMWEKWVMLASLGAACCLMRGTIGDIAAAPSGAETALAIVDECIEAATALGHPPSTDFVARHRSTMTAQGSPLTSSMYRDVIKGAPVEAETILGDLIDRARSVGAPTPLLQAAYASLGVYAKALTRG